MKILGKNITLVKALPWILIIGGTIGLLASAIITYDKIAILQDPNFKPGCDLNPVVSCGSVMESSQAAAFGFPNTFIGLAGFGAVVTTGVVLLAGTGKLKRWYWLGLNLGLLFGLAFVHWLFYQSVYNIGALCPYCMLVWAVTITMSWYTTLYNIQLGHIRLKGWLLKASVFARKHHLDILLFWLLIIAALILKHFWYYYGDKIF
ncbi:MAG TPA: vitamin K epoxide reductase family protein [Candidatus Pristimantibacillus sp.]|jgi:uncharacterized membrane protein|nr:vitamin K epoxide reductase family protein [Candidatus Pristimantibacillus sp.]